ncbi:hypothetical protein [Effusibacillus consociatus]|uniref:Uncharacterized protein n=1 Tax=Effusibacillus consociatus TaxID=1117041 RepID=A0ABV9Q0C4_9BACL
MAKKKKPTIAPGSNNLEKKATPQEIAEGNSTKVTKMSFDEVDPSRE